MSRMIDADALKQECMYIDDIPAVTERDIDNAPTIDAIPVEWLNEHRGDHGSLMDVCIGLLLMEWQGE